MTTGVIRQLFRARLSASVLPICLAIASPAAAQQTDPIQNLRQNYDTAMANFQHVADVSGDTAAAQRAGEGREAMRTVTDDQLRKLFSRTRVPDFSIVSMATQSLSSKVDGKNGPAAGFAFAPTPATPGLPGSDPVNSNCDSVDTSSDTRYTQLIAKEVTNSILAAAAWVCNEDILGENGSAACIPFAIAADVANGFFDTSAWCSGEFTANQVDANFKRLEHIHGDLEGAITSIISNNNANTTTLFNNENANTTTLFNNDNANRTLIINNDNANLATIISNANANKNELRDLILRTQIEADMAMVDGSAVVALYETPTAAGGYLDLVTTIVTQTLARVQSAGGSITNAQSFLDDANAAKAAGNFKTAYAAYRKAYKAAGR
jgi:hypothetical protein